MYAEEMSEVYEEMSSLEMEVGETRTGVLIPGLYPRQHRAVPLQQLPLKTLHNHLPEEIAILSIFLEGTPCHPTPYIGDVSST